jgi:hypothetical protein
MNRRPLTPDEAAQLEARLARGEVTICAPAVVAETTADVPVDPALKLHNERMIESQIAEAKRRGRKAQAGKERAAKRGGR